MQTLIMVVLAGLVYLIVAAYKKVDTKVDEYKLSRNPDDVSTLEKSLFRLLADKNDEKAFEASEHILQLDPNNILALLYKAVYHHEKGLYSLSESILTDVVLRLRDGASYKSLINKAFSVTDSKKTDMADLLIAKAYYYYGHIFFMKNQPEEAMSWRKKARRVSLDLKTNIY